MSAKKSARAASGNRVALLIESSTAYGRELLRGIYAFVREFGRWSICLPEHEEGDAASIPLFNSWEADGMIARIDNRTLARQIQLRCKCPVIDVCANRYLRRAPCIETDDQAIARLAVDHFVERHFKNFAYCGDGRFYWAIERGAHFARLARESASCRAFFEYEHPLKSRCSIYEQTQSLGDWIAGLPKPIAIMASHDFRGWQLLEACRQIGVNVPDDVAVVGVDNDEVLCVLSDPPLTSITPNAFQCGYLAAQALDQWMSGGPPVQNIQIEPAGIVTRRSTDFFADCDPNILQAIRLIRKHACDGLRVQDVLKSVPVSRTVLDHEFKRLLGHTAHDEIGRIQLQRVTELLKETNWSLATIATRCGFRHAEYMTFSFKRSFGMSPKEYRRNEQPSPNRQSALSRNRSTCGKRELSVHSPAR